MSKLPDWLLFWLAVFGLIIILSIIQSIRRVFYYRYESKRQIKLAENGFDPTKENTNATR